MNGDLVQITSHKAKKGDEIWRLILTLSMAGLISGLAIVGAYETTKPMIERNKAEALRRAVFDVVPGAEKLQRLEWKDGSLTAATEGDDENAIYGAYKADGTFIGYAIPNHGSGYQDTIELLYGYDPSRRRVIGMAVLESRETPGLGDRIYKDQNFVAQFRDLAVEPPIVVVPAGTSSADNQVDGLTGATISSKSVVKIVNAGNVTWLERLPEPGNEPPFEAQEEPAATPAAAPEEEKP